MALREQMLRSGVHLFRWRSYVPLLLLPILVLAQVDFQHIDASHAQDYFWEAFCGAVAALGLALRAFTVGCVPAHTSGRNTARQIAASLNVKGPYSVVRHPLYVGNYLIWLGVALFPREWWLVLITTMMFWLHYERIMLAEEEFLREGFGPEFETWAAKTPTFMPDIRRWVARDLPFSWKTVLARENSTLLATIVTFFVLEVTGDFFAGAMPHLDLGWALLLGSAVITYGVLRWLKKKGRLSVEGR